MWKDGPAVAETFEQGQVAEQVNCFHRILAARRDPEKPWTEYDTLLCRYLYAGRDEELSIEEEGLSE